MTTLRTMLLGDTFNALSNERYFLFITLFLANDVVSDTSVVPNLQDVQECEQGPSRSRKRHW